MHIGTAHTIVVHAKLFWGKSIKVRGVLGRVDDLSFGREGKAGHLGSVHRSKSPPPSYFATPFDVNKVPELKHYRTEHKEGEQIHLVAN